MASSLRVERSGDFLLVECEICGERDPIDGINYELGEIRSTADGRSIWLCKVCRWILLKARAEAMPENPGVSW